MSVVSFSRVRLAGHAGEPEAAAFQCLPQFLDVDALAANVLRGPLGPFGPPAAPRVRTRDSHAHRRAALNAYQHDFLALASPDADCLGHRCGEPCAVPPVGGRVVLLAHAPEPVQTGERELGARHLLDPPALLAQRVDYRRIDPGAMRAVTDLGVLIQQAVCHERDAHSRSIIPT